MSSSKTAEKSTNEVSVPTSPPIRNDLVNTAAHFLKNPNVRKSPLSQQRDFLLKKGLTDAEIDVAVLLAGSDNSKALVPYPAVTSPYSGPLQVYRPSIWTQFNKVGSTAIIIGVALYGLHRFYKQFIEPLLFGENKEDRMSHLEEQMLEVSRSLSQLKICVTNIEETLDSQKQQIQNHVIDKYADVENSLTLRELKSEVAIIKSLLLNRHQFPEIPKIVPSIPFWQMGGDSLVGPNPEKLVHEAVVHAVEDADVCNGETTNSVVENGDTQMNGTSDLQQPEPKEFAVEADDANPLED